MLINSSYKTSFYLYCYITYLSMVGVLLASQIEFMPHSHLCFFFTIFVQIYSGFIIIKHIYCCMPYQPGKLHHYPRPP